MNSCRVLGAVVALPLVGFFACRDADRPSVPPLTSASPSPMATTPVAPTTDPTVVPMPPVTVEIRDLPFRTPEHLPCGSTVVVSLVRGSAEAPEPLEVGDSVSCVSCDAWDVKGSGVAVVASSASGACDDNPGPIRKTVHARDVKDLAWAGGTMHAHLDAHGAFYLGRLEGTAPVAEHVHEKSWEILAAIEASGTFTVNGAPQHLGPRQVVAIPPNTKHSWKPDAGAKLVAVQVYDPPGPEQRFVALAADAGRP